MRGKTTVKSESNWRQQAHFALIHCAHPSSHSQHQPNSRLLEFPHASWLVALTFFHQWKQFCLNPTKIALHFFSFYHLFDAHFLSDYSMPTTNRHLPLHSQSRISNAVRQSVFGIPLLIPLLLIGHPLTTNVGFFDEFNSKYFDLEICLPFS